MHEDFSLKDYINSFYKNENFLSRTFYRDHKRERSYKDLIEKSLTLSKSLSHLPDQYIALQLESSYVLFAYLLAGLFSKKHFLIVSSKEPQNSLNAHQKHFPFTKVIKDDDAKTLESVFSDPDSFHDFPDVPLDHIVFNILSSGSTGPSKSIPLSLKNIYASSMSVIDFFSMNDSNSTLLNLPHHHIGGLMILWRAFFSGGSVTTQNTDHYDFVSLVPLQLKRKLTDKEEVKKLALCRAVLIGGAPFEQDLKKSAVSQKISTYETYGMSESSSLVMLNGTPLEGQEIKLDSNGHFLIKGQTLSPILPRDEEGFYHTKDVGVKNPDGTYSFLYRSDLLFKSAGEMIDPMKIEAVVKNYPGIKNAVVTSIPHEEWTEATVLVYQLDRIVDKSDDEKSIEENLKAYLKKELHPHHLPKFYFKAPLDLMSSDMKPKRFMIKEFALKKSLAGSLNFSFESNPAASKLMVYFHGFMEDHTDMMPLKYLHPDFSHLFVDLPGHGESPISSFKDREDFYTSLEHLVTNLGRSKTIYFYGYSMGGRVAIELIRRGLTPKMMILESSSFGLSTYEEKEKRLTADLNLFSHFLDHQNFFSNWYSNPIFGNYRNSLNYNIDIEKKSKHDFREWQASLKLLSPGAGPHLLKDNIESLLKLSVKLPVVGIFGSDDEKYKNHFLEAKKLLPNLLLKEITGAAHNPHKTHLNEVKFIMNEVL